MSRFRSRIVGALLMCTALVGLSATARADSTPFDLGVDAGSLTTAAAANMGTILGVLFGVFIALVIFAAFWKWARRGVKGG